MVYYGLSYNVVSLPGDLYVNNVINGAVELFAYVLVLAFVDTIGRKFMLGGSMMFAGTACIISMIVTQIASEDQNWMFEMAKWLSFIGKFAISGSFCIVFIFAAELFPTEVRCIGIGFVSLVGKIGGVLTPFIILLQNYDGFEFLPYLIFGTISLVAGFCALFLPETAGEPILQTIKEAVGFYSGKDYSISPDLEDKEYLTVL